MTGEVSIDIRRAPGAEDLPLPAYQTDGAAGMDLRAAVDAPVTLAPGERSAIPTGIQIALPRGYEAQVRGRSGLGRDHGIGVVQGVGTIDADFRGHLHALLINHGREPFVIRRGDRVAQLVIAPVMRAVWRETDTLEATARGAGGFGHTGGHSGGRTGREAATGGGDAKDGT